VVGDRQNVLLLALLSHISAAGLKRDSVRLGKSSRTTLGAFVWIHRHNRVSHGLNAVLLAGIAATLVITSVSTASAQNLFEALLGRLWNPTPPVTDHAEPNTPLASREAARADGGLAYCVRLCDGRFFPIQRHSGANTTQICSSLCPASATKIYSGNGIDRAVAQDGKRYSELASAFAYRDKIIPGCTCNGRDAFGLVNTPVADDPTLRPGDVVATNTGLMAYSSGPNGSTFTPISTYGGLSGDLRRQLTEMKIEPSFEGLAPPPAQRAEAPSDRSLSKKQAQAE
jgi:hypothetical protein